MPAYYNEHDPFAAAWIRELIKAGLIPDGDVDERSIEDVTPVDLRPYTQCHFFAGIAVWPYAARCAGWDDDRPLWTGSCPCQPFSAAGKGAGFADERHLWPAFHWLIQECRPDVVIGEQTAGKAGELWMQFVQEDLEALDYAVGSSTLAACGVGAPHIRRRLYWVAHSADHGRNQARKAVASARSHGVGGDRADGRLADTDGQGPQGGVVTGQLHDPQQPAVERTDQTDRLLYADPLDGYWSGADWLRCRDDRWRPVRSGSFPLADGSPARVGRLRGYGNGLVAPLATEFIKATMEVS